MKTSQDNSEAVVKISQDASEDAISLSNDTFVIMDKGRSMLNCLSIIDLSLAGMVSNNADKLSPGT